MIFASVCFRCKAGKERLRAIEQKGEDVRGLWISGGKRCTEYV